MNERRKSGFSLLELLVVFSLMSLLVGMSASGIGRIQTVLSRQAGEQALMALTSACLLYRADHGDWPPGLGAGEGPIEPGHKGLGTSLGPYLERRLEALVGAIPGTVHIVVDDNHDHWIDPGQMVALRPEERPGRLWARVAAYSLSPEGELLASTWE